MNKFLKVTTLVVSFILAISATICGIAGAACVIWVGFDATKIALLAYCAIGYFGNVLLLTILYLVVSLYDFVKNKRLTYG